MPAAAEPDSCSQPPIQTQPHSYRQATEEPLAPHQRTPSNPSVQRDEENSQRKRGQRGTEIIQKVRKPAVKFKKAVIRMNLER